MDAESRQRIQKCYTSLLDLDCTPADLLGPLVEKQVLDFDDQERILAEISSKDKAEKFVSILITKENSYKSFREVLKKAHEFIGEKLDAVEIDYELIKKEQQNFKTFLEQFLPKYYSEIDDEKNFVLGKDIKEDLREELERHGKTDKGIAWQRVESTLLEVFKNVKKEKIKRSKGYRYKRLRRNVTESSDEEDLLSDKRADDDSSCKEKTPLKGTKRQIKDMSAMQLCSILKERFLKKGLDENLLETLVEEEVTGEIFLTVTTEEIKEIFPNLKFGKRKTIINIRDEMVAEEKHLLEEGKYLVPEEVLAIGEQIDSNEVKEEVQEEFPREHMNHFRETFRKFDAPANGRISYRKHSALYTCNFAPSNLINPVRKFLHDRSKSKEDIPQWIGDESVLFIAACLNSRTNGTIYFGVEKRPDFGVVEGVIARQNIVLKTFYKVIHDSFREEDFETVCQCIKPPQFVEVTSREKQRKLYIIEVDVIASHSVVKSRAFVLRKQGNLKREKGTICLPQFVGEDIIVTQGSQFMQFMEKKSELSERRERQEKQMITDAPDRNDLRQKFLNLFAAGNERLTDEIYPLLFVSPLESDMDQTFISERFEFVNDLDPKAIFDFDSCGDGNSLYRFIETDQEKVFRTVTADEFDRENYVGDELYKNFLEDIGTTSHSPWIFCNGYEPLNKPPLNILDWKQKLAVGYKESLRFYSEALPKGRVVPIFLLFSKNYEIMIEAADEALMKFQENWIVMAENENIANYWMDELVRRHLTDKRNLEERCIIGIPWIHVNSMIKEVMGCTQTSSKQIPTSTGAYCILKERVKNELCDLEILGSNECTIEVLRDEGKSVEGHRRRVREEFFRGEQVNWWNFYFKDDHVLQRDKHKNLLEYTTNAINGKTIEEENKVAVIHLLHQPGAGGTTTARQVLWTLKEKYRCCVIKQFTDQTVEQIVKFRNYEDKEQALPPIILIDNGDEDRIVNLYAHLEERAKNASRRSDTPFNVFCVLLWCRRRANMKIYTDQKTVQLKHELSDNELEWFRRKGDYLQQQFLADKGINPKLLISFNILKDNFNPQYIKRTVTEFVDNIEKEEELRLLSYTSLLNSYDLDFQPIPLSAFDAMMEQNTEQRIVLGSVSRDIHRKQRRKHWDASLSESLRVLLNRNAHSGGHFTGLRIINSLFAKEILSYMTSTKEMTSSEMMIEFLRSDIFKLNTKTRSLEQLKKIVRDILKKRDVDEKGVKKRFSPLILEIIENESNDQAQKVLETAFNISQEDAMFAQQVARLFIHSKNWDKAKHYACLATQKKPENSFLWDTYGQVYSKRLAEMYIQCSNDQKPLSHEDVEEAIKLAKDGMRIFQKEQEVCVKEKNVRTNDAGYYAELQVIKFLLDLLRFWTPLENREVVHEFLVSADFLPEGVELLSCESVQELKQLRSRAEDLIRIVEEKESQLKTDFYSDIVDGSSNPFMSKFMNLRLGLDDYFGENLDEIPSNLSLKEQAEYRRRRVKNLGGRSLIAVINMMRYDKAQDLITIHSHIKENVDSEFCNAFDLVTLISVSIFLNRLGIHKERVEDLQNWSKRLFKVAAASTSQLETAGRPYLESFLYPIIFHWPTENRKDFQENLCAIKDVKEALKLLKMAFQNNHPRQREDGALFRKRDTTYFFLGNAIGLDEVVYYEDLSQRHGAKFFKGDSIWEKPEIRSLLLRVKGILMREGLEVSVPFNTRLGNQEFLYIPTAQPIGQRSLWQKEVYFFIGFSWSGPKAYDVSRDGPPKTNTTPTTPTSLKPHMIKPKRDHVKGGLETHDSFLKRVSEVDFQMKKIKDSLGKCEPDSEKYKSLLTEYKSLEEERRNLIQRKRVLLDVE